MNASFTVDKSVSGLSFFVDTIEIENYLGNKDYEKLTDKEINLLNAAYMNECDEIEVEFTVDINGRIESIDSVKYDDAVADEIYEIMKCSTLLERAIKKAIDKNWHKILRKNEVGIK